ncbi:MAG: hypothetical protein JXR56_03110 [Candidatus Cloacimonetes bacterium]|nr:hypothetical protein [Candidatus Cloacimonadota bacterium]
MGESNVIRVLRPSIPTGDRLRIIVQRELGQVINRLNHSFASSPLLFLHGNLDETWKAARINTSLDPNHPGDSTTVVTIDKLLKPGKESPKVETIKDVSFVRLDKELSEISFPKYDIDNEDFYDAFVHRFIELWPEVKRQCADYLDIPTAIEPEEVFLCEIDNTPGEIIEFCFKEFPRVENYTYTIFDSINITSNFKFEVLSPDYERKFWEFLVFSDDEVEDEESSYASLVKARGLLNIAAEVVISVNNSGKSTMSLIKNMGLPIPAFALGDSSTTTRLPYPYAEQLDLFVERIKLNLLDTTSSSHEKISNREHTEQIIIPIYDEKFDRLANVLNKIEQKLPSTKEGRKRNREQSDLIIARAEMFKGFKETNPEWTQDKVAMEYNNFMAEKFAKGEIVMLDKQATGETVRNAYRKMGWNWPTRGWRTR